MKKLKLLFAIPAAIVLQFASPVMLTSTPAEAKTCRQHQAECRSRCVNDYAKRYGWSQSRIDTCVQGGCGVQSLNSCRANKCWFIRSKGTCEPATG